MRKSESTAEESIDQKLIEDIIQITFSEVAECHVCGEKPREGDDVVALAFRPADKPAFELAHVKCTECRHEPTEYFTLGVRELVVEGRVGRCSDQATQSSWRVLLAPEPRAVSPADTTTVHPSSGTLWIRYPIAFSDTFVAADQDTDTTLKPWQRPVRRAEPADDELRTPATDADAKADADRDQPTDDSADAEPHVPASDQGGAE